MRDAVTHKVAAPCGSTIDIHVVQGKKLWRVWTDARSWDKLEQLDINAAIERMLLRVDLGEAGRAKWNGYWFISDRLKRKAARQIAESLMRIYQDVAPALDGTQDGTLEKMPCVGEC